MTPRDRAATEPRDPIWLREQAREKQRTPVLTRERIVATAVEIADREGMAGVSIRRIAAELGARPMSLYAHFETKDDLVAFMHDAVVHEGLLGGDIPADWRDALRALARRSREVALRHPWLVSAVGQRPELSPAILRHAEESLAAVETLDTSPATRHAVIAAVDTFVLGQVVAELSGQFAAEAPSSKDGGTGDVGTRARREAAERYIRSHAESESLPRLAEADVALLLDAGDRAAAFEQGLDWLLAGVAADVAAGASSRVRHTS